MDITNSNPIKGLVSFTEMEEKCKVIRERGRRVNEVQASAAE